MAHVLRVSALTPDRASVDRAAACIREGGLVAFPTETVYGLGADATNAAAVRRIFVAKGRPANDPLIVHVEDVDQVRPLVTSLPEVATALAQTFWPGPLTLVFERSAVIGDDVTAGLDTVAIRVPAHPVAAALVHAARVPIAAPSANVFSRPSPTCAEHVVADLGDRIDLVLDAGQTPIGVESTVVDLTVTPPVVLRPGGVSIEQLRNVLPGVILALEHAQVDVDGAMRSPGLATRHYAPMKPLTLVEGERDAVIEHVARRVGDSSEARDRTVLLGTHQMLAAVLSRVQSAGGRLGPTVELGSEVDAADMAARLYVALRECDRAPGDRILAMQVPSGQGLGLAVQDRLRRASAGNIVRCG